MSKVIVSTKSLETLRQTVFEIDSAASLLECDLNRKVALVNIAIAQIDSLLMQPRPLLARCINWMMGTEDADATPTPTLMRRLEDIKKGGRPCVSK